MLPKINTFFANYPDGEQFSMPQGPIATMAAAAIANIKQPTISTDPRGSSLLFTADKLGPITKSFHPEYSRNMVNWQKWRTVYEGGDEFVRYYLRKMSARETADDWFQRMLNMSPIPAFAKAGINEIKNSIFQRIADVTRKGGSPTYVKACNGELGGVNLRGSTMAWFIGNKIISEMLVMKKVGVFIDMPPLGANPSLLDASEKHPYLYDYKAEDIENWTESYENHVKYYTSLKLKDHVYRYDAMGMPVEEVALYRYLYIDKTDGFVKVQLFDWHGNSIGLIPLNIKRIPFVTFELSDSLMKDVANHQICLINLSSSDVSYALKGNYAFYTEQRDSRATNEFLKNAIQKAPTDPLSVQPPLPPTQSETREMTVGATQGRTYPQGAERPGFINPSPDPLRVSMEKQTQLKDEIRELLDLTITGITAVSAEAKSMDQAGLEAGLSYIGLELENGEKQIGEFWSNWEGQREVPTIKYPKKFRLKNEDDARKEADQLNQLKDEIPSNTFKKEINKVIADKLLGVNLSEDTLRTINNEIDAAPGATSDSVAINSDVTIGILSLETASVLRGYDKSEADKAAEDHAERLTRIAESQSIETGEGDQTKSDPGARGITDLSIDPNSGKQEKTQSRDVTTKDSTKIPVRGRGKGN